MNSLSFLNDITNERILVAPLNWGLGHASRCIPIIKALRRTNLVVLASDGISLDLLRKEFPDLPFISTPAYNIQYKGSSFLRSMIFQTPKITAAIAQEMALAEELVEKYAIDRIISDHRLGFRADKCHSIIMAHQIQIKASFGPLSMVGSRLNKFFINRFDACWIPDYENRSLSLAGDLSIPDGLKNFRYIGPLSRLVSKPGSEDTDILILLSGPEPKRTQLEEQLLKLFDGSRFTINLVRGSVQQQKSSQSKIGTVDLAGTEAIQEWMNRSRLVIARSGYSSIMDLVHIKKPAVLIPTDGQTEQEYLARHLADHQQFAFVQEEDLRSDLLKNVVQLLN